MGLKMKGENLFLNSSYMQQVTLQTNEFFNVGVAVGVWVGSPDNQATQDQ